MNTLNNIQTEFSIRNLENLSGIKAHTIRIWEKRYGLFAPERSTTNIRTYSIKDLQKLLNVSLLYNQGYKISKIALLNEDELFTEVQGEIESANPQEHYLSSFKLSMLNFDHVLFENTYRHLANEYSFREIFLEMLVPLLEEIGLLWQTSNILAAHEHFISNLIGQKLHLNIEKNQRKAPSKKDLMFVTFLPLNEIHELGLLFIHHELLSNGYQSIYLGQSVPINDLISFKTLHAKIRYLSYFSVQPSSDEIDQYLQELDERLVHDSENEIWITGRKADLISSTGENKSIKVFKNLNELLEQI